MSENQVAPEPVTDEPQGQEYTHVDDGCWTAECMDLPKKTGQQAYCPQCQLGIHVELTRFSYESCGMMNREIPDKAPD